MSEYLRVGFYTLMPWIQIDHGTNCKGILCSLIEYLSKSLKFNYSLKSLQNIENGEIFRKNVIKSKLNLKNDNNFLNLGDGYVFDSISYEFIYV